MALICELAWGMPTSEIIIITIMQKGKDFDRLDANERSSYPPLVSLLDLHLHAFVPMSTSALCCV